MTDTITVPAAGERPQITFSAPRLLIDGERRDATGEERFEVINPVDEAVIAEVPGAAPADVDAAVAAARRQFDGGSWSRIGGPQRGRLLHALADLLQRDAKQLAALEALEVGQPSRGPGAAVDTLRYFAGWADKIDGRLLTLPDQGGRPVHCYTRREPVGVIAAIVPWNAPLMITAWKLAPALAAGCTVVIKPPEDAPLTTLHLAQLVNEAGFPPGTVNVVPGLGATTGQALVDHPGVDKISFTGSPEVGRRIMASAAQRFARVTLELGGKSPQIVFADADLDAAAPQAARAFYQNSGQICAAGTRVLVQETVADEFAARLVDETSGVRVGDPFAAGTTIGSLINERQFERVMGYIAAGREEGATVLAGGGRVGERGFFVAPTLFSGSNDLRISQEEIFGPVAMLIRFSDLEEAVSLANATKYGLAAQIWAGDLNQAHRAAAALRCGSVRINGAAGLNPRLPWGGFGESGVGRELSYSGLLACTEEKAVSVLLG